MLKHALKLQGRDLRTNSNRSVLSETGILEIIMIRLFAISKRKSDVLNDLNLRNSKWEKI